MSAQVVLIELFYSGVWNDVTADVFAAEQIKITRGQADEVSAPRPARAQLTFNNSTDKYRPSNPLSPLYGLAGRNTPIRITVGGSIRAVVEASSWAPDRSISSSPGGSSGRAWVDIDGGGILQRINQWTEVLRSPFYTYNAALTSAVGYWSCEDPRGATKLSSPTAGASSRPVVGASFDSARRFAGSAPVCELKTSASTTIGGNFVPGNRDSTAGWQVSWAGIYPSRPGVGGLQEIMEVWTVNNTSISVLFDGTTNLRLFVADSTSTTIADSSFSTGSTDFNKWNCFILKCTQSGGTSTLTLYWMTEDSAVFAFSSTTFSGNTSSLNYWFMGAGASSSDTAVGHVIGVSGVSDDLLLSTRVDAFKGYVGETAAARVGRLCAARGVPVTIIGTAAASWPMGAQPPDTFSALLGECVRTEDGLLFDDRDSVGTNFRTRGSRYNQTPLALTYPGDIYPTFTEILDDLNVHNIITVNQRAGGDYTLSLTSGPVSTQAPPAGVGPAEQRVDVNTAVEVVDLPTLTGWWLNHGTVDLPRFTAVTVNLTERSPTFTAAVAAVDVGDRITITGYVEYVIDLIILGSVETVTPISRSITFTCAPGLPYLVGILDTDLLDSGSTVLKTGITSSGTALTFRTSAIGDVWSTTTPYDVLITGERLTVTAMGAAALVSGAYDQAATCTRSVNGIVKAQIANAPITDFAPARCAL